MFTYSHAACQYCAAGNRSVGTYDIVVSYLHLVVDYHAIMDFSMIDRAAIYSSTGANLHSVTYAHTTGLRDFDPLTAFVGITETIGADNGPRVNDTVLPQMYIVIDGDIGPQAAA